MKRENKTFESQLEERTKSNLLDANDEKELKIKLNELKQQYVKIPPLHHRPSLSFFLSLDQRNQK